METGEGWVEIVTRARHCVWSCEVSRLAPLAAHFHINKNDHKRLRDKPPSHRNTRSNDTFSEGEIVEMKD